MARKKPWIIQMTKEEYDATVLQYEALLIEKENNLAILASCRGQIDSAKAKAVEDKNFASAKWFASVNTRARYAGQRDQELARQISELKLKIRKYNHENRLLNPINSEPEILQTLVSAIHLLQNAVDLLRMENLNATGSRCTTSPDTHPPGNGGL
jgi:hypothetical protein